MVQTPSDAPHSQLREWQIHRAGDPQVVAVLRAATAAEAIEAHIQESFYLEATPDSFTAVRVLPTSTRDIAERDALHEALRRWAAGSHPLVAATELLIRTGWADSPGRMWIEREGDRYWIDFENLPDHIGAYSGGEQRLLRICASIGGGVPISLNDELPGLDYPTTRLVLAAVGHAAGFAEESVSLEMEGEQLRRVVRAPLASWPDD